MNPVEIAVED